MLSSLAENSSGAEDTLIWLTVQQQKTKRQKTKQTDGLALSLHPPSNKAMYFVSLLIVQANGKMQKKVRSEGKKLLIIIIERNVNFFFLPASLLPSLSLKLPDSQTPHLLTSDGWRH